MGKGDDGATATGEFERELYPFDSRFITLPDGLALHYVDEGPREAHTLVMVHGNPSWSFYYRNLIIGLRAQYRIVAFDHIGCGLSEKPGASRYPYTLARRVGDLDLLINTVEPDRSITLVLHDWGGMIGMAWATRNPSRVKRLILMNTAAFHLPDSTRLPISLAFARSPLGTLLVCGANAFSRGAVRMCVTRKPMSTAVRKAYLAPYDSWAHRLAVQRFVRDIPLKPGDTSYRLVSAVAAALPDVSGIPKLICWGEKDFVFDEHFLREWLRRCPEAEVHRFADCGHYVLEDAGTEILALIKEFLARPVSHPGGAN